MPTPDRPAPYRTLPAARVAETTAPVRWLLDGLFLAGGAGILGGAPKTGKSFFALELAVAVASGTPAAGQWAVATPGPVLLLAAEDPLAVVVQRLAALAAARDQVLARLPVDLIVEPVVRLPNGLERLAATVRPRRPVLLILDPLIRVHRADENSAPEMAAILDGLRTLARDSGCAVLLVHHTRKAPALSTPGHGLRGSSDLSAFGDSNLYLRRLGAEGPLELRIEHRAAAAPPPRRLRLRVTDDTARFVAEDVAPADPLRERLLTLVRRAPGPLSTATLRQALRVRKQVLLDLLRTLVVEGRVDRAGREGWTAAPPAVPVPPPMGGNGNADTEAQPE